jgi:hypothetical protein
VQPNYRKLPTTPSSKPPPYPDSHLLPLQERLRKEITFIGEAEEKDQKKTRSRLRRRGMEEEEEEQRNRNSGLDSDLTRPLQPTSVQVSSLPKNQSCP